MQFGETVRQLRLGLGLFQLDISEQTSVSISYMSKVENEKLHFGDYRPRNSSIDWQRC